MDSWILQLIAKNLSVLRMLRLDFSPLPEELADMSELWAEAFTSSIGRIDERQDAERINKAFKKARHSLVKWPAPFQVIELMPRREDQNRLPHDPRQHEEVNPNIAKMTRAVVDLSEGNIDKEEFDQIMEQFAR